MENKTAYPLSWPVGYPRTRGERRSWNAPVTIAEGRDTLLAELERTGATGIILSTNLELRKDGLPYASGRREPADAGVAVYFRLNGADTVLCCDAYGKVAENLRAIAVTVEQLRQISKRGVSDFVKRAFTGFAALPPGPAASAPAPAALSWWQVLGVRLDATLSEIEAAYKAKSKQWHPDVPGGSVAKMQKLNEAREAARRER